MNGFLDSIHVRLFIIIAGFLCHKQPVNGFIRKKVFRILIPLWFFSTLKLLYSLFLSDEFRHGTTAWETFYAYYLAGGGYWFCYCIFFLYLLSIFLWPITDRRILLGIFCALAVLNEVLNFAEISLPDLFQFSKILAYAPYFVLGYTLRFWKDGISQRIFRFGKRSAMLFALLSFALALAIDGLFSVTDTEKLYSAVLLRSLFRIGGIACLVFAFFHNHESKRASRVTGALSEFSLQIMLFDSFFKVILYKLALKIFALDLWLIFAIAAANILLTVLTCTIAKKIPFLKQAIGLSDR